MCAYVNEATAQVADSTIFLLDEKESSSVTYNLDKVNTYNKTRRYRNVYDVNILDQFRNMQEAIMREHIPVLTKLLEETPFESGYESVAEKYFYDLYNNYGAIADAILLNIYLKNMYDKPYLLKHLLFVVANLPENQRNNLEIIPLAGVSNPNIEIQDLSVKCFETWEDKRHIPTLKKICDETKVEWFKNYIEEVIETLEEG